MTSHFSRVSKLCFLFLVCSANAFAGIKLPQADDSWLEIPTQANRLITLSPHLAELVFAAGAGDHLVATVEFSDFPEAAALTPRVGDAFRIDIERIVSLKPDLVIAWDSGNPGQAIDQLRSLGLPVWTVEIRELSEIPTVIEHIGLLSGEDTASSLAATSFREHLETLSRAYDSRPTLDYFYQVAARPLFTINGDQLISKGLDLCGGRNIFSKQPGLAFQVSRESVIGANPDAMFAPQMENEAKPLDSWLDWPEMNAVQNSALFLLPADKISRATPRILDALELACSLLDGLRKRSSDE